MDIEFCAGGGALSATRAILARIPPTKAALQITGAYSVQGTGKLSQPIPKESCAIPPKKIEKKKLKKNSRKGDIQPPDLEKSGSGSDLNTWIQIQMSP